MPVDTPERIALPCHCAGTCAIVVFEEIDLDLPQVWVEHYRTWPKLRWRDRLRVVAAVVRGREYELDDVVLDDHERRRLRDWLDARLATRS